MKKAELKTLLAQAIARQQSRIIGLTGDDNPQVIAVLNETKGKYAALCAVIEAMDAPRPGAAFDLQLLTR